MPAADYFNARLHGPRILDHGGTEFNVLHRDFNTGLYLPDGTNEFTDAFEAIYTLLDGEPGTIRAPHGIYLIDPDVSINVRSNTRLVIDGILRAKPTTTGVNQVVNIDGVSDVVVEGEGAIEGDKYTHDLSASLQEAALTVALTGGETTLTVDDTTGMDSGNRNLVVVADDGTYAFAVYTVTDGTHLALQTAIPAGFVASIGQPVYQAAGEGGMCVRIDNAERVKVRRLRLRYAWGDGVYVTEYYRANDVGTKHIDLEDLDCGYNRRQGLSIVGGRYVTVLRGRYHHTQGAQPQCGIDIEPSSTYSCDDVLIDGALADVNERDGFRSLPDGDTVARLQWKKLRAIGNLDNGFSWFRGSTASEAVDCWAEDNGLDGFAVSCSATVASDDNVIDRLVSLNNGAYGAHIDGTLGGGLSRTHLNVKRMEGNGSGGVEVDTADDTTISGAAIRNSGDHLIRVQNSARPSVDSPRLDGGNVDALRLVDCTEAKVSDPHIINARRTGLVMEGGSDNTVQGGEIIGSSQETHNTFDNVTLGGTRNTLRDVVIRKGTGANQAERGVNITLTAVDAAVIGCDLRDAGATEAIQDNGTTSKIQRNLGYVTEAQGTATVASGSTFIAVTHGLARTPTAQELQVTPTNNLGNAAKFWISNLTSTTFRINVDVDPGATTATFAWQARLA